MATIQIRVDDDMKVVADDGMPFSVKHRKPNTDLLEAIQDTRDRRNLHGPYKTAEEAVAAMLED